MKMSKIFVFCLVLIPTLFGVAVVDSKIDSDADDSVVCVDNDAESFCDRNSLKIITKWWHDLANDDDVRCEKPVEWSLKSSGHLGLFSEQFPVKSFPCSADTKSVSFTFDGKIEDGKFSGFGHLEIDPSSKTASDGSCLVINRLSGEDIVEVSGVFSDGLLEGQGRIVLESGAVVVADFQGGLFHGLRRDWTENGDLVFAGFYEGGAQVGHCWHKIGRSLVVEDCASANRSDEKAVVIPFDRSKPVLAGTFYRNVGSIDEVRQANMVKAELDEESCFVRVEVKVEGQDLDIFYDILHDQALPKSGHEDQPLCTLGQYPSKCLQGL